MITFEISNPSRLFRVQAKVLGPHTFPNGNTCLEWSSYRNSFTNTISEDMPQSVIASKLVRSGLNHLRSQFEGVDTEVSYPWSKIKGGVSNGCFPCKSKKGEIVFSSYHAGKLRSGTNQTERRVFDHYMIVDKPYYDFQVRDERDKYAQYGCHFSRDSEGKPYFFQAFYVVGDEAIVNEPLRIVGTRKKRTYHPVAVGESQLLKVLENLPSEDNKLITSALADYNGKYMDLLTTVAETGETVDMIAGCFVNISKLLRNVKRNHGKTWRAYTKAYHSAGRSYKQKLDRYHLDEVAHRAALKKVRSKRYHNLATGATPAEWWLQFRYGVMPLILTIKDGIELFQALDQSEFIDSRKKKVVTRPSPLDQKAIEHVTERVLVRGKIHSDHKLGKLYDLVQFNPFVTAYELIPLSFVLDWFVNLGDAISAFNPLISGSVKAQYSWKATCSYDSDSSFIEYECYKRKVIDDPLNSVTIGIDPHLNSKRLADAVSLGRLLVFGKK